MWFVHRKPSSHVVTDSYSLCGTSYYDGFEVPKSMISAAFGTCGTSYSIVPLFASYRGKRQDEKRMRKLECGPVGTPLLEEGVG